MTTKTINLETLNAHEVLDLVQFLTSADQLWLAEQLNHLPLDKPKVTMTKPHLLPGQAEFMLEVAAFERLKPELLQTYRGRFVAIYKENVVEVGDNELDLIDRVYERFGYVPCYVELVAENVPRRVRRAGIKVVRK